MWCHCVTVSLSEPATVLTSHVGLLPAFLQQCGVANYKVRQHKPTTVCFTATALQGTRQCVQSCGSYSRMILQNVLCSAHDVVWKSMSSTTVLPYNRLSPQHRLSAAKPQVSASWLYSLYRHWMQLQGFLLGLMQYFVQKLAWMTWIPISCSP